MGSTFHEIRDRMSLKNQSILIWNSFAFSCLFNSFFLYGLDSLGSSSTLEVEFTTAMEADIALRSLEVDEELRPEIIQRELGQQNASLCA